MKDEEIIEIGNRCAKLFEEAWKLNKQVENEIAKVLGFSDVEDYIETTGIEFENDVLIDCIQQGGSFTKKNLQEAISFQKTYLDRRA